MVPAAAADEEEEEEDEEGCKASHDAVAEGEVLPEVVFIVHPAHMLFDVAYVHLDTNIKQINE